MPTIAKKRTYINLIMLLRVIGYLLVIEAAFMLIPLIAALIYKEGASLSFLISLGITGISGIGMMLLKPKTKEMRKREAFLLTGLTWVILSLFGMLPFLLAKTHESVSDAFFETMSGFTTTGVSVIGSLESIPKSILLWRSVVQWIGGLGIILFTLAVVPMLNNAGGMQLFNAEVTGITHDKLRPRVSFTAKGLWLIYIGLTSILICLLYISDMGFFDSLCHGLSTMSTGGFSTSDLGISKWDSAYIKIVMTIFMFLGGVNFTLLYNLIVGRGKVFLNNTAFKWYIYLILISWVIFGVNVIVNNPSSSLEQILLDPIFQTVSLVSSTGIVDPNFSQWGAVAEVLLFILIFTGACAGSTSGGAKIDRMAVLLKFLKNEFYKMMHPSSVTTVTINGKGTTPIVVNKSLAFLFIYGFVIVAGGIALSLLGMPLSNALISSLMAISNSWLDTNTFGLITNYAEISDLSKWILSMIMLIGRLEIFTILLLFLPSFWKK